MAAKNAERFLNELESNEKIKEALADTPRSETPEEHIKVLTEAANKVGYDFTADELSELISAKQKETQAKTDEAAAQIRELDPKEMDMVAGGFFIFKDVCEYSFNSTDKCWFEDQCEMAFNYYEWESYCWENNLEQARARCTRTVKTKDWSTALG